MRAAAASVLVILPSLLAFQPCGAQLIRGRVLDTEGTPLASATVALLLESGEFRTRVAVDEAGRFVLDGIEAGRYWIEAERLGYETGRNIIALSEGDSIEVELRLAVDAIPLDPIIVTASRKPWWEHLEPPALWEFWERKEHYDRLGIGTFITYEDLRPLSGLAVAQAITDLSPFFLLESYRGRPNSFYIRGRFGCAPLIFLDGHPLYGEPLGTSGRGPPLIDEYIHLSHVAGVEVYRGASDVPGEYRFPGANCGVVAIWSLRGPPRGGYRR